MKKFWAILPFVLVILSSLIVIAEENKIYLDFHLVNVTEPSDRPKGSTIMESSIMSEDELEQIASLYIKEKVGKTYFDEHFSFDEVDHRRFVSYIKYVFSYDGNEISMHVAYDPKKEKVVPEISSFLMNPVEIEFDREDAELKANDLDLPEPKEITLVYVSNDDTLGWRVLWDHEPTNKERANNVIEGYLFDAGKGDIIKTYKYHFEPIGTPPDKQVTEKTSFIERVWRFILGLFK